MKNLNGDANGEVSAAPAAGVFYPGLPTTTRGRSDDVSNWVADGLSRLLGMTIQPWTR